MRSKGFSQFSDDYIIGLPQLFCLVVSTSRSGDVGRVSLARARVVFARGRSGLRVYLSCVSGGKRVLIYLGSRRSL